MPVYTFPDVYAQESTSAEGPIQAAALGIGGMIAVTKKGPPGIPLRHRSFDAWTKVFGSYEAASRGDAAYEAKAFFDEGGFELITCRQVNYSDVTDKTSYTGGVANRTAITDGVAATGASKEGGAETYNLSPGDSFSLDVDNVGPATVTFDAAAGYVVDTTTYPVADQDGLNFQITLNGGTAQTITFSGATTTAQHVINQINAQLAGGFAVDDGGQVKVVSDQEGTGSSVAITAGTSALTWGAPVAGTGDVADISAVTAAEVETVVENDTTAEVTVSGGVFTIASPTTGSTSELDFQSGVALTKLGLSVEVIVGTDAGATYSTLKFEAGYRGYKSPGTAGNDLKTKITQNPRHASAGAGSDLAADITASDTSVQVVTLAGINVGSVIKVWDGTNTEYKEVTAVRTVVSGGSVTFFADISGSFTNGYVVAAAQLQTQEFDVEVYESDVLVETWTQMSMLDTVDNYVETKMNDENFGSAYVYATDMDAVAGLGADLPASDAAATALTGGTDETAGMSDADWVGDQTGQTGFYAFDTINEFMPLCTIGNNNAVVFHAGCQYAASRIWFDYIGYVTAGLSGASAVAYRNNTLGIDSSYGMLYAGGMKVYDPLGAGSNPKRTISGLGGIMGVWSRVDTLTDSGPWETPSGEGDYGRLRTALDVGTEYTDYEHGLMNDAHINVLRKFTNTSPVVIWGGRTLDASTAQKFRYINTRRFFQHTEKSIVDSTRWGVFRNNDFRLWGKLKDRIVTYLSDRLTDGAFPTTDAASAFFVKVGITDGVMDQADYDDGKVKGKIGMAAQKPGEFIIFDFSQYTSGVDITEV